jgi:ABC-2 type transport system ATP-binding protein
MFSKCEVSFTDTVTTRPAGVDLIVEAGECVALLGPNGAGKTTRVRNVIGWIEGTADLTEVAGGDPRRAEIRRRLGVVQQAVGLPRLWAGPATTAFA